MSVSQPELVCQTMGLALAEITSDEETTALQEITSKCGVLNQPYYIQGPPYIFAPLLTTHHV